METTMSWTVTIEQDPDNPEECVLPFPEEMINALGWKEGDTIVWSQDESGSWILSKKE